MISNFEIKEKILLATNCTFCLDSIQVLPNKKQLAYRTCRIDISIIDLSKGKLISILNGHKNEVYQIEKNHSNSILSSDGSGSLKLWCNTNKKCLRTLSLFFSGYCFSIFGAMIVIYRRPSCLVIFNFNGNQVKEIKTQDEINVTVAMTIHEDVNKALLIYCGSYSIIIRNAKANFEFVSKIKNSFRGCSFYSLLPFFNLNSSRLELIISDVYGNVFAYEMENFSPVYSLFDQK